MEKKIVKRRSLNRMQLKFAKEFARIGNASKAARNAGYSHACAGQQAARLLKKDEIKKAIAKFTEQLEADELITVEEVVKELKTIAFDKSASKRDRVNALNSLGRHLGMFIDKRIDLTPEALEAYAAKIGVSVEELQAEIQEVKASLKSTHELSIAS